MVEGIVVEPTGEIGELVAHVGSQVRHVPVLGDGAWSFVFHAASLPDGPVTIRVAAAHASAPLGEALIVVHVGEEPIALTPSDAAGPLEGPHRSGQAPQTAGSGALFLTLAILAGLAVSRRGRT